MIEDGPDPAAFVIFGGSGDLSQRKLVPVLYQLAKQRALPPSLAIVGASRTSLSDQEFRNELREALVRHSRTQPIDEAVWDTLASRMRWVTTAKDDGYAELGRVLDLLDIEQGTRGNRLFYLATPPSAYIPIIQAIGRHSLGSSASGWKRIVVEKPFGSDLTSACALSATLSEAFSESEIFRIDHYLGKETVQNILVLRFANGIFEPLWNRRYIDHVQITVGESLGVEERADYYDQAGALRDIVQNHLLQLLALVAMEPPASFGADAVRDEKVKVLRALRPIQPDEVALRTVRAQYGPGYIEGQRVSGYRKDEGVAPHSETETYVALKCFIDNWRWQDTPFYLRTGKRLPRRATEIAIQYHGAPHQMFGREASAGLESNTLVLRLQPDEGISLTIGAKVPAQGLRIRSVNMDFMYGFEAGSPDSYETLIFDALQGDATLFTRRDEAEEQWSFVDPIQKGWRSGNSTLPVYDAGTWGPTEADLLVARDGRAWRKP